MNSAPSFDLVVQSFDLVAQWQAWWHRWWHIPNLPLPLTQKHKPDRKRRSKRTPTQTPVNVEDSQHTPLHNGITYGGLKTLWGWTVGKDQHRMIVFHSGDQTVTVSAKLLREYFGANKTALYHVSVADGRLRVEFTEAGIKSTSSFVDLAGVDRKRLAWHLERVLHVAL